MALASSPALGGSGRSDADKDKDMQDSIDAANDGQAASSSQPDFLFGACEAIGEDLGFDPFYLRVALLALLFFSPAAMIASYAALGGAVALSRRLFPKPAAIAAAPGVAAIAAPEPAAELERERELVAA